MSATAFFYRVPRSGLGEEGEIAGLLARATDLGDDYCWSGYVMFNVLLTLAQTGASLGAGLAEVADPDGEAGAVFFATSADIGTIDSLDLNQLSGDSLRVGLDLDDDELREAVADSVAMLRQLIAGAAPHEVLVIQIY